MRGNIVVLVVETRDILMHTSRCLQSTYKNGGNLLADQLGWSLNVIISQEVKVVFDILDA
jgi:hypothetical protein